MSNTNYPAVFLFLVLAFSISSASVVWKYETGSPVITSPVLFNGNIVVATENGGLDAISMQGKLVWKKDIGKFALESTVYQDELVFASSGGKFTFVKKDGSTRAVIDVMKSPQLALANTIYGIASSNKLYFTADGGLFALERNGSVTKIFAANGTLTPPYADSQRIIFGAGEELIQIRIPGNAVVWRSKFGGSTGSRPVTDANSVYVGTVSDSLEAFSLNNGVFLWQAKTEGWVEGKALVDGLDVYFGSNDGYLYAVEKSSGKLLWKSKTRKALQSAPVAGIFGAKAVIIAGSTDGNAYAFDKSSGKALWQFPTPDWVGGAIVSQDKIIFSSRDSFVYYVDSKRGCSIISPEYGVTVGTKEVKARGYAVSNSGGVTVGISINDRAFDKAKTNGNEWTYVIDPQKLESGANTIACRVTDSAGEETEPYTNLFLFHSKDLPLGQFLISAPQSVEENKEFTVFVSDAQDGLAVENFKISYNGKEEVATSNITFTAAKSGLGRITVSKTGFEDGAVAVNVYSSSNILSLAIPAIAAIGVVALIFHAYRTFGKKKTQ